MKRKLRIGILSLTISLLVIAGLPSSLAAGSSNATMAWSGNDSININGRGDVNLTVSGITGSGITIAGGVISVADTSCVTIESITPVVSGADANIDNGKFAFMNPAGMTTNATFVKVTLKAGTSNCSTTINLNDAKLSFKDTTKLTPATLSKTINVVTPGNDATLKTLTPNTGSLSPAFTPGNTNYTISGIPATTTNIRFTAAVNDPKAGVVSGTSCNLSSKVTTCNIVVKAEDGSTKTYTVVVTKDDPVVVKSNDATLKTLTPNTGSLSPAFTSNNTNYTMKVGSGTTSVNFNAIPNHDKASVISGTTCNLADKTTTCNIEVQAEDGSKKTYAVVVTKDDPQPEKSSDATLKSLSSKGYDLIPTFDPNTTNYTMEAASNATKVNFDAITNHDKASIVSGSTCDLTDKTTTCRIVVQAEDGSEKTYEVAVTKRDPQPEEPPKSNDATLKSLDVSGFTLIPTFNKDNTSYSISVNNNITGLNVTAIPNDEKAKVTISGNNGWREGINTVRITVTAEDGSEKVYIVNVNRKAANNATPAPSKSSDNYLENILVNDGELKPNFDKNNSNYNIKVPNDVEELDLKLIASDTKSTINIIGNDNFKIGMNVVTIEVTAEDGSVRVYTLNVERDEKVNQNKLKDLIITNGEISPRFEPNKYEYEVSVSGKVNKLDITALPEFANSTVEIIGNENLREGNNAILIKVTDENGFVQYYRLNVTKSGKSTFLGLTLGQWLLLLGSLLLIGLLIFILILLLKKRKEEETPKIPVVDANAATPSSPVIEFKPEFNFGSKNGTDDDVVQPGGVLNQYTGYPEKEAKAKFEENASAATEANYEEIPYDPYDANVTKDEIFDAINEAIETKDSKKLKLLYEQERLNREKEALKQEEAAKKSRSSRYHE